MLEIRTLFFLIAAAGASLNAMAQTTVVRPKEIDDVLVNPGIGFTTFQRFNGDALNAGESWTEGYPIVYQQFKGDLHNRDYPMTSIAYFRVYWRFLEPEKGKYRWDLLDTALRTAHGRKQSLMLRVAPYGTKPDNDVPDWYRQMMGDESGKLSLAKWRTNPEDPRYAQYFGGLIRELGKRYDGHPDLESVDLAIVGAWGEGAGAGDLSDLTRRALVDSYLDSFGKTPLVMMLTDEKTNKYALSRKPVGWRVDCLGDMGGFSRPDWSHMLDVYPESIVNYGMRDAWMHAPVDFEACWVMQHWLDKGWDVNYIIDQSLKWHISSFNAKSSPVPQEDWPAVNRWLKKMGYRFVLRKFTYDSIVPADGRIAFTTWWENKGVAPIYKNFPLALRLKNSIREQIFLTSADIRKWLPGDSIYDDVVFVPPDMPAGDYGLSLAIVDPTSHNPKVKLAIAGVQSDGWYPMGEIRIQR
ncbi:MAG TPA: DUF4832 domain-containing protein [Bryobacteraceae bacterium]|nr:DUF4832 domain-containing protein [Bryobacteraceae bacterium]